MNFNFSKIIRKAFPVMLLGISGIALTGCFEDKESIAEQYKDWREKNEQYIVEAEGMKNDDGSSFYTRIVPSWAPNAFVLMHWHNDRSLTASNLMPMDNSTTKITYELFNVDGEKLSDSFSNTDSLYTSRPSSNIIGMWSALTHMNVGDSVTMVIPSQAGYGIRATGGILPYSTLIYNVKLKAVTAYEVP